MLIDIPLGEGPQLIDLFDENVKLLGETSLGHTASTSYHLGPCVVAAFALQIYDLLLNDVHLALHLNG